MGQVFRRYADSDVVARLQIVAQQTQSAPIACHQYQATAVLGEKMSEFQPNAAGCARDQGSFRGIKRVTGTHTSVIADSKDVPQ